MMTTGSYGGVGALIKKRPGEGVLVSEPYAGSPAVRAGLIAGDVILAIDGESVMDLSADECSSRMKGSPGTGVDFLVQRLMGGDTVTIRVIREKVHISDVGLACMLPDSVAYIRMTGFTQGGAADVRKALKDMKNDHPVRGIVLDLRGNGGGLMDEAVKLLSVFLPRNTMVSARGRQERLMEHYTKEEPLDTETPLVVLVNRVRHLLPRSLPSIQDLKRVIGRKPWQRFGYKPSGPWYNANPKITTAKYYIPSGRCVQSLDYGRRNGDGRLERNENGGIVPDSVGVASHVQPHSDGVGGQGHPHEYSALFHP